MSLSQAFFDSLDEIDMGFMARLADPAPYLCETDLCLQPATAEFQGIDDDGENATTFRCDDHEPKVTDFAYVRRLDGVSSFECRLEER